jgi:hypothetical protein
MTLGVVLDAVEICASTMNSVGLELGVSPHM